MTMAAGADGARRDLPWVISADDHVVEPPDLWERWLPAKYRDRGPAGRAGPDDPRCRTTGGEVDVRRGGNGPIADWWVFEDVVRGTPLVMACAGYPEDEYSLMPDPLRRHAQGLLRPAGAPRRHGRGPHRAVALNFPNYPRFAGQLFSEAKDKDLALACVAGLQRLDDRGMVRRQRRAPDPARHRAAVGSRSLAGDRGAAQRRARQKAITFTRACPPTSVCPRSTTRTATGTRSSRRATRPAPCICMHIGSGSVMQRTSADAPAGVTTALTSLNAYMSMTDWLLSGTLLRFPNLKIAFSESQIGWMPFLLERLDRVFTNSGAWVGPGPALTEPPVDAGARAGVRLASSTTWSASTLRHQIGVEQLVFETDYPHQDSTWPNTPELVRRDRRSASAPEELEMLVRTQRDPMLDLDPGDLRPEHLRRPTTIRAPEREAGRMMLRHRHPQRHRRRRHRPRAVPRRRRHRRRAHRRDRSHQGARRRPTSTPKVTSSRRGSSTRHTHMDAQVFWDELGHELVLARCHHGGHGPLRLHPRADPRRRPRARGAQPRAGRGHRARCARRRASSGPGPTSPSTSTRSTGSRRASTTRRTSATPRCAPT